MSFSASLLTPIASPQAGRLVEIVLPTILNDFFDVKTSHLQEVAWLHNLVQKVVLDGDLQHSTINLPPTIQGYAAVEKIGRYQDWERFLPLLDSFAHYFKNNLDYQTIKSLHLMTKITIRVNWASFLAASLLQQVGYGPAVDNFYFSKPRRAALPTEWIERIWLNPNKYRPYMSDPQETFGFDLALKIKRLDADLFQNKVLSRHGALAILDAAEHFLQTPQLNHSNSKVNYLINMIEQLAKTTSDSHLKLKAQSIQKEYPSQHHRHYDLMNCVNHSYAFENNEGKNCPHCGGLFLVVRPVAAY